MRLKQPNQKGAEDENFPVASWLIQKPQRKHIGAFYAFARNADDIADDPNLTADEKVERLDLLEKALIGSRSQTPSHKPGTAQNNVETARRMRQSLEETRITNQHCLDLLIAFRQDAVKSRYADWQELADYCNHSASPVGRYLLDLHGEDKNGYTASDALCNALQVLNHLQDCAQDLKRIDRVYLPGDWMARDGASITDLFESKTSQNLRKVFDRCLDRVDIWLAEADGLPSLLSNRGLAAESEAIVVVAHRLSALLRLRDPLATSVKLSSFAYGISLIQGAWRYLTHRTNAA